MIEVRPATPEDARALAVIHRNALPPGWDELAIRTYMKAHRHACLVGSLGDEPCGFIILRAAAEEAEILTLAVTPEKMRQGVGTALLKAGFGWCRSNAVQTLFLEVAEGNQAARSLYERFGFTVVARREQYYCMNRNSPEAALILRLDTARRASGWGENDDQDRGTDQA